MSEAQVASWIEKKPGALGGQACIRDTRHGVAGLVEWRRLGLSDAEILDRLPGLTLGDLEAAWAYHDRNPEEIDRTIRTNEEA